MTRRGAPVLLTVHFFTGVLDPHVFDLWRFAEPCTYSLCSGPFVCCSSITLLLKGGIQLGEDLGLPDLANENISCPVTFEFLIEKQRIIFFSLSFPTPYLPLAMLGGTSHLQPFLSRKT